MEKPLQRVLKRAPTASVDIPCSHPAAKERQDNSEFPQNYHSQVSVTKGNKRSLGNWEDNWKN